MAKGERAGRCSKTCFFPLSLSALYDVIYFLHEGLKKLEEKNFNIKSFPKSQRLMDQFLKHLN